MRVFVYQFLHHFFTSLLLGFVLGILFGYNKESSNKDIEFSDSIDLSFRKVLKIYLRYGFTIFGVIGLIKNNFINNSFIYTVGSLWFTVRTGQIMIYQTDLLLGKEISTKNIDNQSVKYSLSNIIIFCILSTPFGILMSLVLLGNIGWFQVIIRGIIFSFLFGSLKGGLRTVSKHIALRLTVWHFGHGPWNYSKFLRYCTERGFLQRVGGGYRFVHALLRDHFAETYGKQTAHNETVEGM